MRRGGGIEEAGEVQAHLQADQLADAYAIQEEILRRKLARGARLAGLKAGLTSHAKMKQMGVTEPVFGFLVDGFSVPEGGEVKTGELIHPKVEPEICFVLLGIEVIDSGYRDFKVDLESVVLEKNGQVVSIGSGAAVLGHPAAAVAMLANHLGRRCQEIPAGTLVLSGGVTEAVAVEAGDAAGRRESGRGERAPCAAVQRCRADGWPHRQAATPAPARPKRSTRGLGQGGHHCARDASPCTRGCSCRRRAAQRTASQISLRRRNHGVIGPL